MKSVRSLYTKTTSQLEKAVDRLDQGTRQRLCDQAYADAQVAGYMIGYLLGRGVAGCGDNGHESAVIEGARIRKAVRKAVGFTMP